MNKIINSDALEALRTLPDSCCRTCITSPPYYGLRDYGADGQVGLEDTPELYIENLVKIFREVRRALKDDGATLKTPIVWDKGNWTSGDLTGDYGNQCELIIFAHKGRHKLKNGRPSNLWRVPRDPAGEHPTPKPVALMARCIHNSVDRGGTVLDPFMGSGSTGVAAIREGCHFIGIEIEPKYFDISCRRIEAEDNQLSIFDFI